jgi:hypothetical protein
MLQLGSSDPLAQHGRLRHVTPQLCRTSPPFPPVVAKAGDLDGTDTLTLIFEGPDIGLAKYERSRPESAAFGICTGKDGLIPQGRKQ